MVPRVEEGIGCVAPRRVVKTALDLWRERMDYGVHGSSGAFDHTVADVLGSLRGTLRHVFRCSRRSRLNRANGDGEREKYRKECFHSTK